MSTISIPKRHHIGLAKVLSMPDGAFEEIISNLENSPFTLDFKSVLSDAVASIRELTTAEVTTIVDALRSLYMARAASDKSTSEFINEIPRAIRNSKSDDLILASESNERVTSRLERLFGLSSLVLGAKATSVLFEYEHTFFSARVLTDVRPVFGETPEEAKALMIVHNLKIHYHGRDDHNNFFVALDSKDVQRLIDTLERAKAKAETLRSILSKTNLPYIEPE